MLVSNKIKILKFRNVTRKIKFLENQNIFLEFNFILKYSKKLVNLTPYTGILSVIILS